MATEFKLSYTANDINNRLGKIDSLAEKTELPTKTSELTNDSGFATESYVHEYAQPTGDYALKSEIPEVPVASVNGRTGDVNLGAEDVGALPDTTYIPTVPTNVSAFTNDAGYITGYTETDPTVPSWAKEATKPTYTASEIGLGNVDNTSDMDKPVSTAQSAAIFDAVEDKISYLSQTLTDQQKAQVRKNIGAQSSAGEVVVEQLDTVMISNAGVSDITWNYTEQNTPNNYGQVVAKRSTLSGGILKVEFDSNTATKFHFQLLIYDCDGKPYKLTNVKDANGVVQIASGDLYNFYYYDYTETGLSAGYAQSSFTTQIPDGCTCMCQVRYVPADTAFSSENGTITTPAEFAEWVMNGGIKFFIEKAFSGCVERNQGIANANRYLVTDENGFIAVGETVSSTTETSEFESVPSYLDEEILTVKENLLAMQDSYPKSLTFAFMPDLHLHYNTVHLIKNNLGAIDEISKTCRNEVCVLGGDNFYELGTSADHLAKMRYFWNIMKEYKSRILVIKGNHDDNSLAGYDSATGGYKISSVVYDKDHYARLFRHNENVFNIHMDENRDKLYYYIDFPTQKVRVICLNCVDIPIIDDGSGNVVYDGIHQYGYSNEQLNWVINTALNFEDKKDADEWGVVTIQHITDCPHIPSFSNECVQADHNGEIMYGVFQAFKKKTTYTASNDNTDFPCNVSCDFTNAKQDLICRISGHTHKDWNITYDDVLYISTMQAGGNGTGNNAALDGNTYVKVENTADESAFDFITIDKDSQMIYATRFGVGADREFSFASVDDGNLFTYGVTGSFSGVGAQSDYVMFNGSDDMVIIINEAEKYLEANDLGQNSKVVFRTTTYQNSGNAYSLSASFAAVQDGYTVQPRFLLRCFDADGKAITSGLSGWTYNSYYNAYYKDVDNVTFTLPTSAETFQIGFMFSVGNAGQYVRISNISLIEEE